MGCKEMKEGDQQEERERKSVQGQTDPLEQDTPLLAFVLLALSDLHAARREHCRKGRRGSACDFVVA